MHRFFLMVAAAVAVAGAENVSRPALAECAYCYSGSCYNSRMCGRGCFCLKEGGDTRGTCFSADALPSTMRVP